MLAVLTTEAPTIEQAPKAEANPYGSLRSLAESQLQIQYTVSNTYDAQAVGVLALNGALAAAAVASAALLGHDWWLALFGLLVSSGFCLIALAGNADRTGPSVANEISKAESLSAAQIDRGIAEFLAKDLAKNKTHLQGKRSLVWMAVAALGLTIIASIFVVLVF